MFSRSRLYYRLRVLLSYLRFFLLKVFFVFYSRLGITSFGSYFWRVFMFILLLVFYVIRILRIRNYIVFCVLLLRKFNFLYSTLRKILFKIRCFFLNKNRRFAHINSILGNGFFRVGNNVFDIIFESTMGENKYLFDYLFTDTFVYFFSKFSNYNIRVFSLDLFNGGTFLKKTLTDFFFKKVCGFNYLNYYFLFSVLLYYWLLYVQFVSNLRDFRCLFNYFIYFNLCTKKNYHILLNQAYVFFVAGLCAEPSYDFG